jgi:hypothetical protein|tara:strand:+ start:86 stop:637 length:552 start_codon:yes stop_codon:yes gene_type:complete
MSTFKQKKELKAKIKAAEAAGKSRQTIGRLQYKLNNLSADPKGNAVRTKSTTNKAGQTVRGSVIKTGNGGIVRTKPNPNATKGKRIISKGIARPLKTGGHPSAGRTVVPKKKVGNTVTTTGLNGKSKTVAAGSGKVIDIKSEGSIKTNTGKARNINGVGPNAAMNKRIKELERLIEKEKNSLR